MADSIPDLWSTEIGLDELSPVIILNTQAANIQRRTKGLIVAELIQRKSGDTTELFFDLKSQAARHRSRLMVCRHSNDDVYPVWVTSQALDQEWGEDYVGPPILFGLDSNEWRATEIAHGQDEFLGLVSKVLTSSEVRSKISSMIAKSNETKQPLDHLIVENVPPGSRSK